MRESRAATEARIDASANLILEREGRLVGMGIVDAVAVSQTEVVQEQAKGHSRAWEGIWPADPLGRSARIGAIILAFLIGGLLGLAFGAGAGSALTSAILVTFWEALIRPFVRRLHDRVWARIKARQAARLADLSLDGGGL